MSAAASQEFLTAWMVRQDYPELARLAAGHGVNVIEDAEAQTAAALDEIQFLRNRVRNLRAINDGLLEQLAKVSGRG